MRGAPRLTADRAHVPAGARGIALEERVAVQPDARSPVAHGAREIAPRAVQLGRHLDHPRRVAVRLEEGTEILGSTYVAWRWSKPRATSASSSTNPRVGMQMPRHRPRPRPLLDLGEDA